MLKNKQFNNSKRNILIRSNWWRLSKKFDFYLNLEQEQCISHIKALYANTVSKKGSNIYKLDYILEIPPYSFTVTQINTHRWQPTAHISSLLKAEPNLTVTHISGIIYTSTYSQSQAIIFTVFALILTVGYLWLLNYGNLSVIARMISIVFINFPALFSWWNLFTDRAVFLEKFENDLLSIYKDIDI